MCLGIPGEIVDVADVGAHKAVVEISGVRRDVNVGLVLADGIEVGDWVLVHVGFAMCKVDYEEAQSQLAFMRELGQIFDDEIEQFRESTPL